VSGSQSGGAVGLFARYIGPKKSAISFPAPLLRGLCYTRDWQGASRGGPMRREVVRRKQERTETGLELAPATPPPFYYI
jgi:hypothetical protein